MTVWKHTLPPKRVIYEVPGSLPLSSGSWALPLHPQGLWGAQRPLTNGRTIPGSQAPSQGWGTDGDEEKAAANAFPWGDQRSVPGRA